ncbi:serine/threonine-protein kinase Nek3 isoform X1 [Carassius auratus]|uniref:non-specific serine/threonine protein kinase n=2 Tax=Carassius TaxID=7956 RepID=A0A6P6QZ18_CARAU|nr:serine/threonine-protein kinase Nek3 isoform X1 [Carassius auratus]XP_026138470.1 serine/threonine-protein kinase Nek3 isoform X1 [Carassius auratus]XP_052432104.1 serine/threonine-protein kinase Nek3 isoform X1 [Carassius gibelio]XP_052432105.1 serine/threonine-protein kinase Nek3 isoform X1 [Carassius gibelio]
MDQYSLVKVIGQGSFGRALLVQPINGEQNYVMKEIRLPKDDSGIRNSRREAVLLSRMKHSNVVAFIDSFEADGHLYIVMEFCSGGDLLLKIRQQKNVLFTEDVILKWFAQMCLGTKHIHDKRVLHRDLKSKNIFLTDSGTVKLGDFGSACSLNSAKAYAQTYVGTPYYVSPEIWDNKPYNNKSDVWSLGCVLYELCTLQHPFQSSSWKSLILKVCRGTYAPLPSHFSYELHYLIKNMFKTNPKDRPSVHTILSSHRVSRLLHKHLVPEKKELVQERTHHWKREEGEKVAMFLGQKSLVTTTSTEGTLQEEQSTFENNCIDDPASRKRWAVGTCNTVMGVLRNADIISTGSMENAEQTDLISEAEYVETQERRVRKQWDKDPPERLLSILEKVQLCYGFETYTLRRDEHGDKVDGPEMMITDYSRLEPRSDDEDTDFEEECPYDWINELEEMMS